jgi:hypothetical protein
MEAGSTSHEAGKPAAPNPRKLVAENNHGRKSRRQIKAIELQTSLKTVCRIRGTKSKTHTSYYCNERIFFDIKMHIWIEAPLAQRPKGDLNPPPALASGHGRSSLLFLYPRYH